MFLPTFYVLFSQLFSVAAGASLSTRTHVNNKRAVSEDLVLYWGQASAGSEESLEYYCANTPGSIYIISFISSFGGSNELTMNIAGYNDYFSGTGLLNAPSLGAEIEACQSLGKKVLISLGGADGTYGFTSDTDAENVAQELWDYLGGGSSTTRPFGDAKLDGFDIDAENNIDTTEYAAFVNKLRELYATDTSKTYYVSAAPQCPYPDASVGYALENSYFDFINIQFYNNYCSLSGSYFNLDTWQTYATTVSKNPNIGLMVGLAGSSSAAGSGYVTPSEISSKWSEISSYANFGGFMVWDASQANDNVIDGVSFAQSLQDLLDSGSSSSSSSSVATSTTSTSTSAATSSTSTLAAVVVTTAAATTSTTPLYVAPATTSSTTSAAVVDPATSPVVFETTSAATTTYAVVYTTPVDPETSTTAFVHATTADPATTSAATSVEAVEVVSSSAADTTVTVTPVATVTAHGTTTAAEVTQAITVANLNVNNTLSMSSSDPGATSDPATTTVYSSSTVFETSVIYSTITSQPSSSPASSTYEAPSSTSSSTSVPSSSSAVSSTASSSSATSPSSVASNPSSSSVTSAAAAASSSSPSSAATSAANGQAGAIDYSQAGTAIAVPTVTTVVTVGGPAVVYVTDWVTQHRYFTIEVC